MLQTSFNEAAAKGATKWIKELVQLNKDNAAGLILNGENINAGVINDSANEAAKQRISIAAKKKKEDERTRHLRLELASIAELQKLRQHYIDENKRLWKEYDEIEQEIKDLTETNNALQAGMDSKDYGLDEDGKLANKELEKAIAEYEKKLGWKVDRNSPEDIENVILIIMAENNSRINALVTRGKDIKRKIEHNTNKIEEIDREIDSRAKVDMRSEQINHSSYEQENEIQPNDESLDDLGLDDLVEEAASDDLAVVEGLLEEDNKWNPSGIDLIGEFGKAANPPEEKSSHDINMDANNEPRPVSPPDAPKPF